jgi:hypothetical protein
VILKLKTLKYRKDLLKEWPTAFLASCRWYLTCLADSTPKSKRGLREKFEDGHLNKPTSIDSNFQGGKKSHDAKRIRKTKNQ